MSVPMLADRIVGVLDNSKGAVCDQCLSQVAIIGDEKLVQSLCAMLGQQGRLGRGRQVCALCGQEEQASWLAPDLLDGKSQRMASPADLATASADSNAFNQLRGAFVDSCALQARLNEAITSRLMSLENELRETRALFHSHGTGAPREGRFAVYLGNNLALTRIGNPFNGSSFKMLVDTTDLCLAPHLISDGQWEPGITGLLSQFVRRGMSVVDIGANFGYFTLLLAHAMGGTGRIYSFEPDPRNYEILKKNVFINGIQGLVQAFPYAILDSRKQVELHKVQGLLGNHCLFEREPANPTRHQVSVEAISLDEIVEGEVDVMKIDAEGSEPLIFKGMQGVLARSPTVKIIMEFNVPLILLAGVDPSGFIRRIQEIGFKLSLVNESGGLNPFDESSVLATPISTLLLSRE